MTNSSRQKSFSSLIMGDVKTRNPVISKFLKYPINIWTRIEIYFLKLKNYFDQSNISVIYKSFSIFLNCFAVFEAVWVTYFACYDNLDYCSDIQKMQFVWISNVEYTLSALFAFDWIIYFFTSDNKLKFLMR